MAMQPNMYKHHEQVERRGGGRHKSARNDAIIRALGRVRVWPCDSPADVTEMHGSHFSQTTNSGAC